MKSVIERTSRRGSVWPPVLMVLGIGLFAQTAPTCIPPLDSVGTQSEDSGDVQNETRVI